MSSDPRSTSPSSRAPDRPEARGRASVGLQALALAALTWLAYGSTLELGIFGWDSWALVDTSRIASWSDFWGTFRETFMDGRLGLAYYRPVLNLALALDWALWGTRTIGYQLAHLAGFLFALLALWTLARRLAGTGPGAALAAFAAALVFALYPAHWEAIPVVCRRHDVLGIGFVAATLCLLLDRDGFARERASALGALTAFAAAGVKETGYAVVPLALWVAWAAPRRAPAARATEPARGLARAARRLAPAGPAIAGAALLTLLRWSALGGLGGDEGGSPADGQAWGALLTRTFLPQAEQRELAGSTALLLAALAGGLALAASELRPRPDGSAGRARGAHAIGLALLWIGLACAATSTIGAGRIRAWHSLLPAAGAALLLAALLGGLAAAWARARRAERALQGLALAPIALLFLWQASYSQLFREYDTWARADPEVRAFLAELEARIRAAPDGANLTVETFPRFAALPASGPRLEVPMLLSGHGLRGWAHLAFPERRVLVLDPMGADSRLADGVVVTLADAQVLDESGAFGAFQRMLAGLAADSPAARPAMLRYRQARQVERDAAAAKAHLIEGVAQSAPASRAERLEVLARWFEALADPAAAEAARAAARTSAGA